MKLYNYNLYKYIAYMTVSSDFQLYSDYFNKIIDYHKIIDKKGIHSRIILFLSKSI